MDAKYCAFGLLREPVPRHTNYFFSLSHKCFPKAEDKVWECYNAKGPPGRLQLV